MPSLEIYDAITFVAERNGETEAEAWKSIKDNISGGWLPAWIRLDRDLQPFEPGWIAKLAQFLAADSPAPTPHPDGPTVSSEWPHEPPSVTFAFERDHPEQRLDCTEHRMPATMTDFPARPPEGSAEVIYFDPPGILGRDGKVYHRGCDFQVDQARLGELYSGKGQSEAGASAGPDLSGQPGERATASTAALPDNARARRKYHYSELRRFMARKTEDYLRDNDDSAIEQRFRREYEAVGGGRPPLPHPRYVKVTVAQIRADLRVSRGAISQQEPAKQAIRPHKN
jgi:hypothetical protein